MNDEAVASFSPRPSPNIWEHPEVYELENRAADPDGLIEAAMRSVRDWTRATVLDIGCGSGFHLPRFATDAELVVGLEPHPPLARAAARRLQLMPSALRAQTGVVCGLAQQLPLTDCSVDVVHARWAYFFGPGCEPGLAELARVVRPGGTAFVIDNDATRSTFGGWFRRQWPAYDAAAVERFWRRRGWQQERLTIRWEMPDRAVFEDVVRIEFAPALADRILAEHPGRSVGYAVSLYHRTF